MASVDSITRASTFRAEVTEWLLFSNWASRTCCGATDHSSLPADNYRGTFTLRGNYRWLTAQVNHKESDGDETMLNRQALLLKTIIKVL